ncbi:DNA-directed RNA polymerase subunit delta [Metamycoplasma spumans]|uniref:DNA-directed RNA polymerase subunit delta n=1 Tax=Metamycoplasma spumans TaxID=92406 RepID=UPI00048054B5
MQYKTLVDVAKEILLNHENLRFGELFENVKNELFERWRSEASEEIDDEKLLENKRGELYRLMTIDGRFFHNEDGTWTAIRPDARN